MATKAYIMIETATGKSRDVIKTLRSDPAVETVDAVLGPYDVIVVLTAPDLNVTGEVVASRIQVRKFPFASTLGEVIEAMGNFLTSILDLIRNQTSHS